MLRQTNLWRARVAVIGTMAALALGGTSAFAATSAPPPAAPPATSTAAAAATLVANGYAGNGKPIYGNPVNRTPRAKPALPETVIPPDSRVRVTNTTAYPYRAMGELLYNRGKTTYMCTGWLIGKDVVATAGHCVYYQGAWSSDMRFFPGRNGAKSPYGGFKASGMWAPSTWVSTTNELYDYAIVKLGSPVGSNLGYLGFKTVTNAYLNGHPVTRIVGYPADKSPWDTMWSAKDKVRAFTALQVFYGNDTYGGESGSAVFDPNHPCNGPCSFGFHTYGFGDSSGPGAKWNHGTRITSAIFKTMLAARNGQWPLS